MILSNLRTLLFLPADRPDRLEKAAASPAGGVILDLEDGVAPAAKDAARAGLAGAVSLLRALGRPVVVRVNAGAGLSRDIAAMAPCWPDALMLPKTERPEDLATLAGFLAAAPTALRRIFLLESPAGVLNAATLAALAQEGDALAFGSEDYAAALSVPPGREELDFPARQVALAARAHGLAAFGVIGSIAGIADQDLFARSCLAARGAGFTGALTIHPAQVATANAAFGPAGPEIEWAIAVIEDAALGGEGAIRGRDGRMIDRPVLERARAILARR
ncbi:HpcH/HpaI aldolase/citrate lyase family protein [Pseudogemmobacter humi]|uniref:(3S)-malyl-CoA thioesterase n=1 Tax=Pseudogemmobacter humi TaxID=2483812 RepID=A0A3P5WTZ5_9RHOB|nr:CoA ester lyase [Pseudogemmobacter humi]VDC22660.1 (3S)-malyl-CoA thioesterase [Pseudogemmobacter humi]